jgi:hypothetical protein
MATKTPTSPSAASGRTASGSPRRPTASSRSSAGRRRVYPSSSTLPVLLDYAEVPVQVGEVLSALRGGFSSAAGGSPRR